MESEKENLRGSTRADRERKAYDEEGIWDRAHSWHLRFLHVFESPNTLRYERLFNETIRSAIKNKRALEIGCGDGIVAEQVFEFGPSYLFGIDISQEYVNAAKLRERKGRLEFVCADVSTAINSKFDLIYGRSILHHIDYRETLKSLYDKNLNRGGVMIFMEPLGSNPLIKLYHLFSNAHTSDEKSFERSDLLWFKTTFLDLKIHPFNLFTLPLGMMSSKIFRKPNNFLLRFSDIVDVWLARTFAFLLPFYRHAVFIIRKS